MVSSLSRKQVCPKGLEGSNPSVSASTWNVSYNGAVYVQTLFNEHIVSADMQNGKGKRSVKPSPSGLQVRILFCRLSGYISDEKHILLMAGYARGHKQAAWKAVEPERARGFESRPCRCACVA